MFVNLSSFILCTTVANGTFGHTSAKGDTKYDEECIANHASLTRSFILRVIKCWSQTNKLKDELTGHQRCAFCFNNAYITKPLSSSLSQNKPHDQCIQYAKTVPLPETLPHLGLKRFSTWKAPQAAYAALTVLCVTGRAGVQPKPQTNPALTDFCLQPYSHTQP